MLLTRRHIAGTVLAPAAVCLLWFAGVGVNAHRKAPQLVGKLEQSGALSLDPATLPPGRVCTLLAVQDPTFYRHHGIGLFDGPPLHTTVTQSICKGLFFEGFSPGLLRHRKIMLMVDAWVLDGQISKQRQLRVFMNRAYFGNMNGGEVLGFEAAARAFFGRNVRELSDHEYLALVAMLVAPNTYHVVVEADANATRVAALAQVVRAACAADRE